MRPALLDARAGRSYPTRTVLATVFGALVLIAAGILAVAGSARAAVPSAQRVAPQRHFGTGPLRAVLARAKGPAPRLTVLGDSVPAGTACGCDAFGRVLAQSIADRRGAPVGLVNAATPGQTTHGLLTQVGNGSLNQTLSTATVVTLTVGANDFDSAAIGQSGCTAAGQIDCYGEELGQFQSAIGRLLTAIRARLSPGARLDVTGYWNVFQDGAVGAARGQRFVQTSDALTRAVNANLVAASRAAGNGTSYVDLYTPFENSSPATLTALLAPDGDHPSAAGHRLIARTLLPYASAGT